MTAHQQPPLRDVCDFCPFPDDHSAHLLTQAVQALGILRNLHNLNHGDLHFHDPALRLHLLSSLQQELQAQLLRTVLAAYDHGYTYTQIAVLLNHV